VVEIARAAPKLEKMTKRSTSPGREARIHGTALWLLLLSIVTHAFLPAAAAAQKSVPGSAFSAGTSEVSLASRRAPLPSRLAQLRSGDDEGSAAGGGADDALVAEAPLPPALPLPAGGGPVRLPLSSLPADGGAASFAARAPPAL
jgi:hypothetical protein